MEVLKIGNLPAQVLKIIHLGPNPDLHHHSSVLFKIPLKSVHHITIVRVVFYFKANLDIFSLFLF